MTTNNDHGVLRIVDANMNRVGEALRFLEEIARFALDDARLSAELKNLRHKVSISDPNTKRILISAREDNDVGFDIKYEVQNRTFYQSIIANSRRAEESLRVLEETAKIPGTNLEPALFQDMRFQVYAIEKQLLSRISRIESIQLLKGLYVVLDTAFLNGRNPVKLTDEILRAGTKAIQLRAKDYGTKDFIDLAQKISTTCRKHNALLIINDRLDVALAADADGLHIGQDDMPVKTARQLMPMDKIIGVSASSLDEAIKAKKDGADYLGVGAIYATPSKPDAKVTGKEMIQDIKDKTGLPIVAIGGINIDNCRDIIDAGADSIAVISAVLSAPSPLDSAIHLIKKIGHDNE